MFGDLFAVVTLSAMCLKYKMIIHVIAHIMVPEREGL